MSALLPIGSVVLLKGARKKLMIIGIMQTKPGEDKVYDYLAVPYPEGFIGQDNNFLFSHEDINDVVFTGYSNPEREAFMEVAEYLRGKHEDEIRSELDGLMQALVKVIDQNRNPGQS